MLFLLIQLQQPLSIASALHFPFPLGNTNQGLFKQLSVNHGGWNPFSQAEEKVNKLDLGRRLNIRMCPSSSLSAGLCEEDGNPWGSAQVTGWAALLYSISIIHSWVLCGAVGPSQPVFLPQLLPCRPIMLLLPFSASFSRTRPGASEQTQPPSPLHWEYYPSVHRESTWLSPRFVGSKIPGATKGGNFPGCNSIIILLWVPVKLDKYIFQ